MQSCAPDRVAGPFQDGNDLVLLSHRAPTQLGDDVVGGERLVAFGRRMESGDGEDGGRWRAI